MDPGSHIKLYRTEHASGLTNFVDSRKSTCPPPQRIQLNGLIETHVLDFASLVLAMASYVSENSTVFLPDSTLAPP